MPKILPLETQWCIWGVLGGHKFKTLGKLSNWHQLWFTSAGSSGNGHYAKNKSPLNTTGGISGGGELRGHKLKSMGKLSNGWTDWHQIWYTSADSSGNGHRLNTIRPSIPQGHFGGFYGVTHSKVLGSCQTAAPKGTKFCTNVQIHLGMDIRQTNCPSRHKGGAWGFLCVKYSTVWGSCQTAAPIGTKCGTRRRLRLGIDIG